MWTLKIQKLFAFSLNTKCCLNNIFCCIFVNCLGLLSLGRRGKFDNFKRTTISSNFNQTCSCSKYLLAAPCFHLLFMRYYVKVLNETITTERFVLSRKKSLKT